MGLFCDNLRRKKEECVSLKLFSTSTFLRFPRLSSNFTYPSKYKRYFNNCNCYELLRHVWEHFILGTRTRTLTKDTVPFLSGSKCYVSGGSGSATREPIFTEGTSQRNLGTVVLRSNQLVSLYKYFL